LVANLVFEGFVIFAAVAVLQIPGKSNFAVITLATRHPHRDVFVGATVGLAAATVVSVTIGYGAETLLAPYLDWVKAAGGAVLMAFGLREILRGPGEIHEPGEAVPTQELARRRAVLIALGLTFLLEMGDTTQILAIVLVASTRDPLLVFLAATAALATITAISVTAARYFAARVPEERLRLVLGAIFLFVGALTIVWTFEPRWIPVGF